MPTPTVSLTVSKILPCRPAEAFRAWTVPELFQQWFTPGPGIQVTAEVDLRKGGRYRLTFRMPEDKPSVVAAGEFLVINAPHYLEYTWSWTWGAEPGQPNHTVVKVEFRELAEERTEVVLTHEGFNDPEDCDGHTKGWTSILDHMAAALGSGPASG